MDCRLGSGSLGGRGDSARLASSRESQWKWRRSPLWTPGQTLAHGRYSGNRGPHGPLCMPGVFTCSLASFPGGEAWWRVGLSCRQARLSSSGWVTWTGSGRLFREQGTILPTPSCACSFLPSQKGLGGVSQESHWHMGLWSLLLNGIPAASSRSQGADGSGLFSHVCQGRLWCSPAQTLPVPANHPAEILARLPHSKKLRLATAVAGHGPHFEKETAIGVPHTPT